MYLYIGKGIAFFFGNINVHSELSFLPVLQFAQPARINEVGGAHNAEPLKYTGHYNYYFVS